MTRPKLDPKLTWQKRKPYSRAEGYVASLKCKFDGGWIVIYDRKRTDSLDDVADTDGGFRWCVVREPVGKYPRRYASFSSEAMARTVMNAVAEEGS